MKFKNIVGNPPFQEVDNTGKRKSKNSNLWSKFFKKCMEDFLEDDGNILYIIPKSVLSSTSKSLKYFKKYDTKVLEINTANKYFKDVGIEVVWFNLKKSNNKNYTYTKSLFKKNIHESNIFIDSNIICIPEVATLESTSIFKKFFSLQSFDVVYNSYYHATTQKEILQNEKNNKFKYKIIHTPTQTFYSNVYRENYLSYKVIIPLTTYYEKLFIDKECLTTQGCCYIECNSKKDALGIKNILSSKLYRFVANLTRWSNFNTPEIMKRLPKLDQNIKWTDKMIYEKFNLTNEEILLIESIIK